MANTLLGFCVFIICWLVLFTHWFFRRTPPDCDCGGEMVRNTTLRTAGNVAHHVPCWACSKCGAVSEAHSHGPVHRLTNWWKKDRSLIKPATP